MKKFKNCLVFAPLCAICGFITAFLSVSLFIQLDVIRNVGMTPLLFNRLKAEDIFGICWFLFWHGLIIMGPVLVCYQEPNWRLVGFSAITNPLGLASPIIALMTVYEVHWYQCVLNGLAWLSLPIFHCLLSIWLLRILKQRKVLAT
jgi:hypothetical protein